MKPAVALLLLLAAGAAGAEVYKWKDENGKTHYGDRPPAGAAPAEMPPVSVSSPEGGWDRFKSRDGGIAELAGCIAASGARLYGASWCSQCKRQLRAFGKAAGSLPYVECSTDGTRRTTARACEASGVSGYPTWVFASGQRRAGVQSLQTLAQLAGCS